VLKFLTRNVSVLVIQDGQNLTRSKMDCTKIMYLNDYVGSSSFSSQWLAEMDSFGRRPIFIIVPTCTVNSLQGKYDVNVRTGSKTLAVKMQATFFIIFKLKVLEKEIVKINPLYTQKALYTC
jgi:hypothetical protein